MKLQIVLVLCYLGLYQSLQIEVEPELTQLNYPIRFGYIDRINSWWPPEKIAGGIGVPGYAYSSLYNYIGLAFWGCGAGPQDIVLIWANPVTYFGAESIFGKTKDQIQQSLRDLYHSKGMNIMISAFGATEFPTSQGEDPVECATKLGTFVLQNNLDGVDIDWEDNTAMNAGVGEAWLITFQKKLRQLLPTHIISHAPQAPYFKKQAYKNGAYITVDQQVGNTIDFYNIQFYNQGDSKYDTYETLFTNSGGYFSGTSVKQIIDRQIPSRKIVVGKPVTTADASNTGWMDLSALGSALSKGYDDLHWYGGVMFWQYVSDVNGDGLTKAIGSLKQKCDANHDCK